MYSYIIDQSDLWYGKVYQNYNSQGNIMCNHKECHVCISILPISCWLVAVDSDHKQRDIQDTPGSDSVCIIIII